jgi:hypothetical protein
LEGLLGEEESGRMGPEEITEEVIRSQYSAIPKNMANATIATHMERDIANVT